MNAEKQLLDLKDNISLRDAVYQTLKNGIMTGEFAPGERLLEIPLANQLGVSRTPVREAIKRLEREQFVEISPRCGAKVSGITDKDAVDALEVRVEIERMAVRMAAANSTKEHIRKLKSLNLDMEAAFNRKDIHGIFEADNNIHRLIAEATGNNVLISVMDMLEEHVLRYRVEYIRNIQQYKGLIEEHYEIITAIEKRESDRAEELMTRHIKEQLESIRERIREKTV